MSMVLAVKDADAEIQTVNTDNTNKYIRVNVKYIKYKPAVLIQPVFYWLFSLFYLKVGTLNFLL